MSANVQVETTERNTGISCALGECDKTEKLKKVLKSLDTYLEFKTDRRLQDLKADLADFKGEECRH